MIRGELNLTPLKADSWDHTDHQACYRGHPAANSHNARPLGRTRDNLDWLPREDLPDYAGQDWTIGMPIGYSPGA